MSTAPSRDDETELPSSSAQQGDTVEERDLSPADLEPRGDTPEKHTSSSANGTDDDDDDDFREQALTAGKTASMAATAAQSRRPWRRIDQEDAESIASSTDVPSASTRKTEEADSLLHDAKSDVNESSAPPETLANNVEKDCFHRGPVIDIDR
ncbi:hypothetical protein F1559_002596 [Cyanidiococcus yangmingshanensis]|uniref:Uncharacterized protein n=1 Tax=Cyanidiococcus yangmingshanensis TaxID=2690220 RepID=A0A7J7ICZ8_9RHOD|nr:hypothetical protein F1559_002596 [Cyanidiococcus yangmingshanensis]